MQSLGQVLESMGVEIDLEENQQLTEVLVIAKGVDFNTGDTALVIGTSAGLDWVAQRGLLNTAQFVMDHSMETDDWRS